MFDVTFSLKSGLELSGVSDTQKRIMQQIGMVESDLEPVNISIGSVIGITFFTFIIVFILTLDVVTIKKEYMRLKQNLGYR